MTCYDVFFDKNKNPILIVDDDLYAVRKRKPQGTEYHVAVFAESVSEAIEKAENEINKSMAR